MDLLWTTMYRLLRCVYCRMYRLRQTVRQTIISCQLGKTSM